MTSRKKLKRTDNDYVYYEKHHITPKCMGGDDSKENLVLLTAREHFLCHWLLVETYPDNNKLKYAFWMMVGWKTEKHNGNRYIPSSRIYEYAKQLRLEVMVGRVVSQETRKKISEARKGMRSSEATKRKISKSMMGVGKGKVISEEHKRAIAAGQLGKGRSMTDEHKKKIGAANRGREWSNETRMKHKERLQDRIELTCPYCELKSKSKSNMKRYHFENCKNK